MTYVRIRPEKRLAWHNVRTPTRMPDTYIAMCGRTITTQDVRHELPAGPSCELCLRAIARRDEQ